jgi:hypothetical protein
MLSTFLDKASGLLSRRFLLAYWFPTLIASIATLLLPMLTYGPVAIWQWWQQLGPAQGQQGGDYAQLWVLLGALLLVTLLAYLLQAFTRPLVRFYEGYWRPWWMRRWFIKRATNRWQQRRKERADAARNDLARYAVLQDCLHYEYPSGAEWLLPTKLGNVFCSIEVYPVTAYGMDQVFWLPRLLLLLPEGTQTEIEDALTPLLTLLNLATLITLVSVGGAIYLWQISLLVWWTPWVVLIGGLLLARLSYEGAVAHAREYGQRIRAAVDLYRFDLLKALHQSLPTTPQEERALWERLEDWLYNQDRGAVQELIYEHGNKEKKPEAVAPAQTA